MEHLHSQNSMLRIIDASFNRAMEGLRVVEEYARMHLNDHYFSSQIKQIRHDLASTLARLDSFSGCLRARDLLNDVGTEVETASEYERSSILEIVRANFARVLQSLRSIEEYSKIDHPESGKSIESIRYRVYACEKALINLTGNRRLRDARIYVLTDARGGLEEFEKLIRWLVDAEVDLIQLRDKRLDDRQLIEAGRLLGRLVRDTSTNWIMNDRADLAALANADGVHLGQTDISVAEARRIIGLEKWVGVSTHSLAQAEQAMMEGASYIGMGPAFPSTTKSFDDFASHDFIQTVSQQLAIPSFAIGGIDPSNVRKLVDLGVKRVAVSGAVMNSGKPHEVIRTLQSYLPLKEC
ncbi:MAG: thiamine phosphate synthase [Planctomycetota bacterium]